MKTESPTDESAFDQYPESSDNRKTLNSFFNSVRIKTETEVSDIKYAPMEEILAEVNSRVVRIVLERCDVELPRRSASRKRKSHSAATFFCSSVNQIRSLPISSDPTPVVKKERFDIALDSDDRQQVDEYGLAPKMYRFKYAVDFETECQTLVLNDQSIEAIHMAKETSRSEEISLQMLFVSLESNLVNTTPFIGWKKASSSQNDQLVFQCLFCPLFKDSAKDISTHVTDRHEDMLFVINKKRPVLNNLVYMMCSHCEYASIDVLATWVHFAFYHRVPGILSVPLPKVIKPRPSSTLKLDMKQAAKCFPFYCCTKCRFITVDCRFMAEHVIECSPKDCDAGICAPVVKVSRPKTLKNETYKVLLESDDFEDVRVTMFVCLRCDSICFNKTLMLEHHLRLHSGKALVFKCFNQGCGRRVGSHADMVQHFKEHHQEGSVSLKMCCYVTVVEHRGREICQCI